MIHTLPSHAKRLGVVVLAGLLVFSDSANGQTPAPIGCVIYREQSWHEASRAVVRDVVFLEAFPSTVNVTLTSGDSLRLLPGQRPLFVPYPQSSNFNRDGALRILAEAKVAYPHLSAKISSIEKDWSSKTETPAPPTELATAGDKNTGTSFTAKNGEVFRNWRVTRIENGKATIAHDDGITNVEFSDFPDHVVRLDKKLLEEARRIAENERQKEALLKVEKEREKQISAEKAELDSKNQQQMLEIKKSAEAGDVIAQREIGMRYAYGVDADRNVPEAIGWLTLAAEQKDAEALYQLAIIYGFSDAIEKNTFRYITNLLRAADLMHFKSAVALSDIFREGKLADQRIGIAVHWMIVAQEIAPRGTSFELPGAIREIIGEFTVEEFRAVLEASIVQLQECKSKVAKDDQKKQLDVSIEKLTALASSPASMQNTIDRHFSWANYGFSREQRAQFLEAAGQHGLIGK